MNRLRKGIIAALSLFALAQPQAAMAQQCVRDAEVAALFVYIVPPAIEAVRNSCEGRLQSNGFLATGGQRLSARYAALQNETWPRARVAALSLFTMANGMAANNTGGLDPVRIFQSLPDEIARPLGDAMIMQKVAEQLNPQDCRKVELVLATMSVIEPRDAGALLGAIANLVGTEQISICRAD